MNLIWGPGAVASAILMNRRLSEHWGKDLKSQKTGTPWVAVPNWLWRCEPNHLDLTPLPSRFLGQLQLNQTRSILGQIGPSDSSRRGDGTLWGPDASNFCVPQMSSSELQAFNSKIAQAEERLISLRPHYAQYLEHIVQAYLPLERTKLNIQEVTPGSEPNPHHTKANDFGMSTLWFKGAIFFSRDLPEDLDQIVENLAHEITHHLLIQYQLCDTLIAPDSFETTSYSGIRNEARLSILSLHGAAALTAMSDICFATKRYRRQQLLARLRRATLSSLCSVKKTELGEHLYRELVHAEY